MKDEEEYIERAEEAVSDYMKGKNDNELKLIKDFITKINNGKINNKDTAASEFRKLKLLKQLLNIYKNICLEKILNQKKNMKKV